MILGVTAEGDYFMNKRHEEEQRQTAANSCRKPDILRFTNVLKFITLVNMFVVNMFVMQDRM